MTINPSARLSALGASANAVVNDATSLFVNPAGLAGADKRQIFAAHTDLFSDSRLDSLAFTHEAARGAWGVSAIYLDQGRVERVDENLNAGGDFSAYDLAVGLSYGHRFTSAFSGGLTLRAIHQQIESESAQTMAADIGLQSKLPIKNLSAGFTLSNIGPGVKFISERQALPTAAEFGLGYTIGNFLIALDTKSPIHGGKSTFGIGTEFRPVGNLALRTGYLVNAFNTSDNSNNESEISRFAGFGAGVGLKLGRYEIDYALVPHAELSQTQILSLLARF